MYTTGVGLAVALEIIDAVPREPTAHVDDLALGLSDGCRLLRDSGAAPQEHRDRRRYPLRVVQFSLDAGVEWKMSARYRRRAVSSNPGGRVLRIEPVS